MLIIEDGTGKSNAQAYVSADDVRAFATARGLPVPSNDSDGTSKIEAAILAATDYLETVDICFGGRKTSNTQALKFPRKGLVVDGEDFPDNQIPKNLKTAQIRLALEVLKGVDLMPTISGNFEDYVIKSKVGPIEEEFADPTKFDGTPTFTAVDALLRDLIGEQCGHGFLTVYRL